MLVECHVTPIELGKELLATGYPVEALASLTKLGEVAQIQHVSDSKHASKVLYYGMRIWLAPVARLTFELLDLQLFLGADLARERRETSAHALLIHHGHSDRLLLRNSLDWLLAKVRLL